MTDRRNAKNNAAKSAARQLQGRTGLSYREALSATQRIEVPHTTVTFQELIGLHVGHTSAKVCELVEKLPEGAVLTVIGASSLTAPRDTFRQELVNELIAAVRRKQLVVRLLVGDASLCRQVVVNYPGLAATPGIEVGVVAAESSPS